jgi:subtilisin
MKACLTASMRRTLLTLSLLHGTAGVLLAQGPQDYLVRFRDGTDRPSRAAAVQNAGAALGFNFNRVNVAAVRVPNANALAALLNHPSVLAVIPDRPIAAHQAAHGKPGGGGGPAGQVVPRGVVRVGVPTPSSNGSGVGVAVVDTGVDLTHADLNAVDSFNAFGGTCQDDMGHGTHVAGIVAALDNAVDVLGVAPSAQVYCVKVLDGSGSGSDSNVMAGLEWVLDNFSRVTPPIRVINMSLGRPGTVDDNQDLHDLITALDQAGVLVVVSAGNTPSTEVDDQIPAGYPEVVAVSSTTAQAGTNQCRNLRSPIAADTASYFTTDGPEVTVSAPGEDQEDVSRSCFINSVGILSTRLGGGTTRMSGTSMAAPHVAGIAARYFQAGFSASSIHQLLRSGDGVGVAPLDSPTVSYTFDGVREGIAKAP